MMHKNGLVVAVKVGGRILREKDGVVRVPFGSEYSLLIKNIESRKASVKVSIDGQDVMDEKSLLLSGNTSLDLERFVENLDSGNRFKFIRKTQQIVDHRGDRIDDGIIRVEFAFEQVVRHTITTTEHYYYDHHHHHDHDYWRPWYRPYYEPYWTCSTGNLGNTAQYTSSGAAYGSDVVRCSSGPSPFTASEITTLFTPLPDEGITVKGAKSDQHFSQGHIGILDPSEVITIRLVGIESSGEEVKKPITVKDKLPCPTCGLQSGSWASFCNQCGTSLCLDAV